MNTESDWKTLRTLVERHGREAGADAMDRAREALPVLERLKAGAPFVDAVRELLAKARGAGLYEPGESDLRLVSRLMAEREQWKDAALQAQKDLATAQAELEQERQENGRLRAELADLRADPHRARRESRGLCGTRFYTWCVLPKGHDDACDPGKPMPTEAQP